MMLQLRCFNYSRDKSGKSGAPMLLGSSSCFWEQCFWGQLGIGDWGLGLALGTGIGFLALVTCGLRGALILVTCGLQGVLITIRCEQGLALAFGIGFLACCGAPACEYQDQLIAVASSIGPSILNPMQQVPMQQVPMQQCLSSKQLAGQQAPLGPKWPPQPPPPF